MSISGTSSATRQSTPPSTAVQGWWEGQPDWLSTNEEAFVIALGRLGRPVFCIDRKGAPCFTDRGTALLGLYEKPMGSQKLLASAPPCPLENLGDPGFCSDHGLRYPYIAGSMAHGISSVSLIRALAAEGMLAFYGAAGQAPEIVRKAIDDLSSSPGLSRCGINLIYSPNEPDDEAHMVQILLEKEVELIEASAYLDMTLPVVRFRVRGIHGAPDGSILAPHRIIAKVSRTEVASKFLSPPPEPMLQALYEQGEITHEQRNMARKIPVASDLTAEADSGGHTDNRPAISLLPTIIALRDQMQRNHGYHRPPRVGLGGGISTPLSAAAAFAMGAAYIVTGSVNQACIESGTSDMVREMLGAAKQADIAMAPAADMFEMGGKIQALKTGTMFPMKAARLYSHYQAYGSLDEIPPAERQALEKNYFRAPLDEVWSQTCAYFEKKDPGQVRKAEQDQKHRMALIFRSYLGQASRWAISGETSRKIDFQVWCGPAMGAFNEWTRGSFLEKPGERRAVTVALNLLHGAAVLMRLNTLRIQGMRAFPMFTPSPMEEAEIRGLLL